jgi:hypothetical protein
MRGLGEANPAAAHEGPPYGDAWRVRVMALDEERCRFGHMRGKAKAVCGIK